MRFRTSLITLILAILSTASAHAFTHDFQVMREANPVKLTFNEGGTIGTSTADDIVYTCGGSAVFGLDHVHGIYSPSAVVSIKLLNSNDYVTISPAIENLVEVTIRYEPNDKKNYTNIKVYASRDGSSWGSALSGTSINYTYYGYVLVHLPKNAYYLKIVNDDGSKDVSITSIVYTQTDCNCFEYVP